MTRTAIYARVLTVTHSQRHAIKEQIDRLRARLLPRGRAPSARSSSSTSRSASVPREHLLPQNRGTVAEYERTLTGERTRRGRLAGPRGACRPFRAA